MNDLERKWIRMRDASPAVFKQLKAWQDGSVAKGQPIPFIWNQSGTCRYIGTMHDGHPVILLTYEHVDCHRANHEWWDECEPILLMKAKETDMVGGWFSDDELKAGFKETSVQDMRRDLYEFWLDGHVKQAEFLVSKTMEITGRKFEYDPDMLREFYRQEYYYNWCEHYGDYEDCTIWDKAGVDKSFDDVAYMVGHFTPPSSNELVPWIVERDNWLDQLLHGTIASWTGNVGAKGDPIIHEEQFFWEV